MDPLEMYEALLGNSYPRVKRYGTLGWKPLRPGDVVQPQDLVETRGEAARVNVEGYPTPQEVRPNSMLTWDPFFAPPDEERRRRPIVSGVASFRR